MWWAESSPLIEIGSKYLSKYGRVEDPPHPRGSHGPDKLTGLWSYVVLFSIYQFLPIQSISAHAYNSHMV